MLKLTAAEILQTFIQRLGVPLVEFADGALELPISREPSPVLYDCRDIPYRAVGLRLQTLMLIGQRLTIPRGLFGSAFLSRNPECTGRLICFKKSLKRLTGNALGRARNWMSPLIETAGSEITMAIVSMTPLKSQVSL
jgi:hypothetical protein